MNTEGNALVGERRALRRGALQILSGFGVRTVARVLLLTFVARVYGIADFGRLGETVAVLELAAAFATFGLSRTLLGKLGEDEGPPNPGKHIAEALILAMLASGLITTILWFAWPYVAAKSLTGSQFLLIGIPLISLSEVATTATRHFRTVFWDTLVKALVKPWSFLLLGVLAYYWVRGMTMPSGHVVTSEQALLVAYVGSLALSAAVAGLAMARSFGAEERRQGENASFAGVLALARTSLPIAINDTGVYAFRRIDIILLSIVAGPKASGIYYLAQQIGTIVEKIRHLFDPMLAPIVAQSRSLETIGAHLKRLVLFIFATQLGIICLFVVFGGYVLDWFGSGFTVGLLVVVFILIGELMDGTFALCELPMVYRNPVWPPRMVMLTLALEMSLVWILADRYGPLGAAIGFACAMTALAIMRIGMVHRLYGFRVLSINHLLLAVGAILICLTANMFLPVFANLGL